MAKIDRYNGNVEAFASQADSNRRTTFGTTTIGDDTLDGNFTQEFFTGWQIVGPNEQPTLEDFNAAFFTISRVQAYLHQAGVPEWNGAQEYHNGSMVNRAGVIYICNTDSHISVTPPESDAANWRLPAAGDISYDNTASGLAAETSQSAIDEISSRTDQATETESGVIEIATNAEAQAGTDTQRAITPSSLNAAVGLSRSWQNVIGSRSDAVTYTNSTGRDIFISVSVTGIDGPILRIDVEGTRVFGANMPPGFEGNITGTTIVPNGQTYEATTSGEGTISDWKELR